MTEYRGVPRHIISTNMGNCKRCGRHKDLRFNVCFDCATDEEKEENIKQLFSETTKDQMFLDTLRTIEKEVNRKK